MDAYQKSEVDKAHKTRFVAFKKPFENIAFSQTLIDIEKVSSKETNDSARVVTKTVRALTEAGSDESGEYKGEKWGGKYMYAPEVYFSILEKGKDKLISLGSVAKSVSFGLKTGANNFFFLDQRTVQKFKIEEKYLALAMKSPKESEKLVVDTECLELKLFMCHEDKEKLEGTNALKYIEWGEAEGYSENSSVKSRKRWYDLGDRKTKKLHFNYGIHEYGSTYVGDLLVSDNFHDIDYDESLAIYLNSTLFWFFQNILGRKNFGDGMMKIQTYEFEKMLVMTECLSGEKINDYDALTRKTKSIFEECGIDPESDIPISEQEPKPLPDRKELDEIIFDELELTEEERKDVYRAVCQLVHDRISKANSV
jgi:hypothetical protein